ncbi:MAG TPA: diguanylate cyclase [Planktothrix sp.]|jgi:diguanylate cyclase (GGDEF)-like protein
MAPDQTKTIRMPKLASIPTLHELRLMATRSRREGRSIEQSWRLTVSPDSFQLRVQWCDDGTEPKWTVRQVTGVEVKEIWSGQTTKLLLIRAAAARVSGVRYEDLPQEDDDGVLLEEDLSAETAEIGDASMDIEVDCADSDQPDTPSASSEEVGVSDENFAEDSMCDADPDSWNEEIYALGSQASAATALLRRLVNPVTGLHTHAATLKVLEHELLRFQELHTPLSLMLLDITVDDRPLDTQGVFAASLRLNLAKQDLHVAGHFDSGSLALAMPCTGPTEATVIAQRVLELLNAAPLTPISDNKAAVSIGVASLPEDGQNLADLVAAAASAMEKAKRQSSGLVCNSQQSK